jgi:glycosyltransferase involved in cell wall biosynthesis
MKILIVSFAYFPELSPRAFRWTAIAEELVNLGHSVKVVCASNHGQAASEHVNGVEIHRAGSNAREGFKNWLRLEATVTSIRSNVTFEDSLSYRRKIGNFIKSIYSYTARKILWPDFAAFWYFAALKAADKSIKNELPDVIVTVSLPFTSHLVGLALKRRYEIPWVVDIGDPFSFMTKTPLNNHKLFKNLNARSESQVLQIADAVTVTTEGTKYEYLKHFSSLISRKIIVIPPLFSAPTKLNDFLPFFNDSKKIRLVFAGTLYRAIRDPLALLAFFRHLASTSLGSKVELHFLGVINDCKPCFDAYDDLLGSKIFLHGLVSRRQALQAMKEANVLVNLGNSTHFQLPSKVVEYVILGKPVLNITKFESDSSQNFLTDFNGVCNVTEHALTKNPMEFNRVKKFIHKPPAISQIYLNKLAFKHGAKAVTKNYLEIFESCTSFDS